MNKKFFIVLITALLFMGVGCGKGGGLNPEEKESGDKGNSSENISGEELFVKYCDLFVNTFQEKDLESYGIDPDSVDYGDYDVGYYSDADSCVAAMKEADRQLDEMCEIYGGQSGIDCGEARQTRYNAYRAAMTYEGCMVNGRGMRCGLFDTTQSNWVGADADQIANANDNFAECLEKVKYSCEGLPKNW